MAKQITSIEDLQPDVRNARAHTPRNVGMIVSALQEVGAARSGVIDEDGRILAGNATWEALAEAGIERVKVVEADGNEWVVVRRSGLTEEQKQRLALYDNRTAELADWDAEVLAGILADDEAALDGLFYDDELAELLGDLLADEPPEDPGAQLDRAAELQEKWQVERGQVWEIPSKARGGEHRIICGDCTDVVVVQRVMQGEKARVIFTSPPYAEQRDVQYSSVAEEQYVEWWGGVQGIARLILSDDGSFFVNLKPHSRGGERSLYVFELVVAMVQKWNWVFIDEFCWYKGGLPGTWKNKFKNEFEPIYHFALAADIKFRPLNVAEKSDKVKRYKDKRRRYIPSKTTSNPITDYSLDLIPTYEGRALPGNVLNIRVGKSNLGIAHAAAYPVRLPEFFVAAFSDEGDVVLDPFIGSGTTLVACERWGRLGRGVEIEPKYCAVALERLVGLGLEPRVVK